MTTPQNDDGALWKAVGFMNPEYGGPPWLFIWSRAVRGIVALRPNQLFGSAGVNTVAPDFEHWRLVAPAMDPRGKPTGKVDWVKAASMIVRACYDAGPMKAPPEGVHLRAPGRPPGKSIKWDIPAEVATPPASAGSSAPGAASSD